ncbi:MAG: hypothetical protein AAGI25_08670, partial [Bacteroidota bacterium]
MKRYYRCLLAFLLFFPLLSQAQTDLMIDDDTEVQSYLEETFSHLLDWGVISYALYMGELDAESQTLFAKMVDKYKKDNFFSGFFQEIDEAIGSSSGLEQLASELFKATGIRIYFAGKFLDTETYILREPLNRLLRGTLRNKVDPSIVVWVEVQGNAKQGYDLSIDIEASDAIKQRKYDLDKADDRNPFWGIVGQGIRGRSNMGITIKQSAMAGTGILIEEIEE